MDLAEYQQKFAEDSAPGWEALDVRLREVYGEQEPQHWGTVINYQLGGPDPIDGISAYSCRDGGRPHLHFTTFGYSSLYYDEESVGGDESGYGFEMTFRLASELPPAEPPIWVCNLLQNLARYVFETGKVFGNHHWVPANGPIHSDTDTDIVGLGFVVDPTLGSVGTPHGRVDYIQAFGLTQSEIDGLIAKRITCREIIDRLKADNPLLITDLNRRDASRDVTGPE